MALQGDGKIVVVGYAVNNSGRDRDFALIRYNADGSLDTRFNGSGKVTTAVSYHDGHWEAVAVEKDGKIVAAGWVSSGDNSDFAVVRFGADGKLDTSFNAAGSVLTAVGSKPPEAEDATPRVSMAVINDPDGYTNVRDYDGKVVAKVKEGERFIAAKPWNRSDDPKWSVRLKSGLTGFMDKTRIHVLPDEPLMKLNYDARKKEWRKLLSKRVTENDEAASQAKGHGVDYNKTLVRASEGNLETLAKFVRGLPLADQVGVRGTLIGGMSEEEFANGADVDYLQRYFPETTKILFRGEIVDWTSRDGRYSIRKTFTDPLDLAESKVSHAELIEKATGQTLCDLTNADIGVGGGREGSVLWSPDSKRFAYVASDETTVYQISGKSFTKINLPL